MQTTELKSRKSLLDEEIKYLIKKFQEETSLTVYSIEIIPPRVVSVNPVTQSDLEIETKVKLVV